MTGLHPMHHARTTPDKPACVMAGSGESVSYALMDARANRMAQLVRSLGIMRGGAIAVFMENSPRYFDICWGAQRSGIYFTCISSRLTAGEAAYIIRDCGARAVFASGSLSRVAGELPGLLPEVKNFFSVDGNIDGFRPYETAAEAMPADRIFDESPGTDMLYSSGTTGRPKGVRVTLPEGEVDETPKLLELLSLLYGFDGNTVYLSPAPLYHAAPLRYNMAVQRLGGTCIVMEKFDPEEALRLIEKYRVTHSQWVPTMFVRMLKLPGEVRSRYDLSSHTMAIHAAAPCPVEIKRRMLEWWGPIIHEYYAGTEGNGYCTISSEEWLAHEGSVGRAILGEVKIVGEDGRELPPGEEGTIYFANGPQFEYHNDPEKTAQARNEQGWTTLGDVGRVDDDGYLYLTDRKAYMIISGGVNVYPQETEDVLITHPSVADVAVIGVPNDDLGEEVKAVVQPVDMEAAGPELEAELIAFCRERLSAIKCPKSVDFEAELPRHPTGKLYKRLLRERYWSGRENGIV
ncbi:MAG: acyl-CoA synthetase [bacterium]